MQIDAYTVNNDHFLFNTLEWEENREEEQFCWIFD
jgi:hypothetical protein